MSAPDLYLSPDQQDLLVAALNSNQAPGAQRSTKNSAISKNGQRSDSMAFTPGSGSEQTAPGSGRLDFDDDSPFLDFSADGDFDDYNFDPSDQMIGDLPDDATTDGIHEKRKSIDGRDEDDEGGGKRREGDDKTAKKPGRKPLTSEPTNKRKAQNRAAQRAFRERKERHLKDLETKVEELEKTSEATNHENGLLKAQVEKLQVELKEYRKRLSWIANGVSKSNSTNSQQTRSNLGGNDFRFEFPKFGDLPSATFGANKSSSQNRNVGRKSVEQVIPATSPTQGPVGRHSTSSIGSQRNSPANNAFTASPPPMQQNGVDSLSGLFSPSILQASRHSSLGGYFPDTSTQTAPHRQQSVDANYAPVPGLTSNSSNTDSPGSSSESHHHMSSIGTSPETLFNSPGPKQDFGLNSFGDNNQISGAFGSQDMNSGLNLNAGFDWLSQQNGGSFDPVLFGDYRETQDNILSQDFGSFFNEAYPLPELGSPDHSYGDIPSANQEHLPKNDLMQKVDAAKEGEEVVPADKGKMLTCNKIWDRLQSMEKFRNGEIDIDNLCSELRAKAKCSEGGAVVDEKHVNKILGL